MLGVLEAEQAFFRPWHICHSADVVRVDLCWHRGYRLCPCPQFVCIFNPVTTLTMIPGQRHGKTEISGAGA